MPIYQPAEDSFFLSEFVEKEVHKNKNIKKILDMGSGSGIQAEICIKAGANPKDIILADINQNAIEYLKKKFIKSKIFRSNLFDKIPGKILFDLIIFNPPYLSENKFDKEKDTTGGKNGNETIKIFLKQAKNHLDKDGKILLLTSSLTRRINFPAYKTKILGKKKLFFEELRIWELRSG